MKEAFVEYDRKGVPERSQPLAIDLQSVLSWRENPKGTLFLGWRSRDTSSL